MEALIFDDPSEVRCSGVALSCPQKPPVLPVITGSGETSLCPEISDTVPSPLLSLGGHGGRPPTERQPESQLLRPAGHLPADQRGERPEPAGPAEGGSARVPDAVFARHQLDPAVHRLQSSRGMLSHTFYLSLFRWISLHVKSY